MSETKHPFLDPDIHVRWSDLTPGRVEPDIAAGIRMATESIDAIADQDHEELTFANTFLALESATENLSAAWGRVSHLDAVCNSPELRKSYNAMLPQVSEFFSSIPLQDRLWTVLKKFAQSAESERLDAVQTRFINETLADFRESGAELLPSKKQRFQAIQKELDRVTQKYSENVLDATNAFELIIEDRTKLAGLPESALKAARMSAQEKGYGSENQPAWRFTLQMPSYLPAMKYLEDESIRKQLWEGYMEIGRKQPNDNTEYVWKILELRDEKAKLLGKAHFADLVLERRMAKSGSNALRFVEDLHDRIESAFKRECAELEEFKAGATGSPPEPLEPWETLFWSERMRKQQYAYDEEALRPFFPIDAVIDGLFRICEKIFAIRISEEKGIPAGPDSDLPRPPANTKACSAESADFEVWHPEVRVYSVYDEDSRYLGSFYADWHPRESKRSGAWMNHLWTGGPENGECEPHLGLICGNLTPSLEGRPALLSHDEVLTIFHEFGHLLHHLVGEVEIKSLNGINVAWDFVELPSQIMENWAWEREGLDFFARHYETGEPIPDDLFQKIVRARNFQAARLCMRQLSFGKMDLELHVNTPSFRGRELDAALDQLLVDYHAPTRTKPPTNIRQFGHLFSSSTGYAAGYYSYKWAEVLDADAFIRFQQEGVLNPNTGRAFKEKILSRGNAEDPALLFRNFMGREPELDALLARDGLLEA